MSSSAFAIWSGGKDAHYALDRGLRAGLRCELLVTFIDEDTDLALSHRLPPELIEEQARLVGIPLMKVRARTDTYERELRNTLFDLRCEGITRAILPGSSGRTYRDWFQSLVSDFDMHAVFPLWGIPSHLLVEEQRRTMTSTIIQIERKLSESYLGRELDREFIEYMNEMGFDPSGSNGEYDTFVCESPLMSKKIVLTHAERRATPEAIGLEIDFWKVE
jgi:uncharacterized protein (TIGR00290 family)